jgi:hypothetical protein
MDSVQGVILEDYGKGLLQQDLVTHVLEASRRLEIPSGYDPKDNHELDVKGITFATPNRKETFQVANVVDRTAGTDPLEDLHLLRASNTLVDLWQPGHLLMTLGAQGMLLNNAQHQNFHIPTRAREVFDVSGAGDTVIATVLLALAAGAEFVEAAELEDPSVVKVVKDLNDCALYFSRSLIPHSRDQEAASLIGQGIYFRHLGLYAYRPSFLSAWKTLPPHPLEQTEKLEQLRALVNGFRIALVETEQLAPGIDTPEDLKRAESALSITP